MGNLLRSRLCSAVYAIGITAIAAVPAPAHHAFAAEFDGARPVKIQGRITKVEWSNPHVRFYVAVPVVKGVSMWELEMASPNVLIRQGWSRFSLKNGDLVTVRGFLAKDGSRMAAARAINFDDGRTVLVGTAGDGGPVE